MQGRCSVSILARVTLAALANIPPAASTSPSKALVMTCLVSVTLASLGAPQSRSQDCHLLLVCQSQAGEVTQNTHDLNGRLHQTEGEPGAQRGSVTCPRSQERRGLLGLAGSCLPPLSGCPVWVCLSSLGVGEGCRGGSSKVGSRL